MKCNCTASLNPLIISTCHGVDRPSIIFDLNQSKIEGYEGGN
jgi:hypothetical protein